MKTPPPVLPLLFSLAFALGAAAQDRPAITISAADIAPAELRADEPAPGKWWLNRDAKDTGVPGGRILMTGRVDEQVREKKLHTVFPAVNFTPYRVPALRVDPHASGWYRIHVGLYNRTSKPFARLLAKLSDEPYPEYLQAPEHAKEKVVEVLWKPADLTGRQIVFEQPPAPWPHPGQGFLGGISHIRLVPMSDAEAKAAQHEIELPPVQQRLFGMFDYTDEVFWWGKADTADAMKAIVYRHQQTGFGRIYWRCFGTHLDNSLAVPEAAPRWTEEDEAKWCAAQECKSGWLPYINMTKQFDPLKVASDYGREIGVEVHAWVRLTNFNRAPYAEFWHQNRDKYAAQMVRMAKESTPKKPIPLRPYQYSKSARVLSFAYPEVRAFYVKFFKQLASTGTPGIMIDLLRHPPLAGYEPISSEAFKRKYGTDMEELDLFKDPRCTEHLAGYLEAFLTELRREIGPKIEISVRSAGPENFGLRGKKWIESGLINTIVDGNYYSGNGPRASIDATIAAAGIRGLATAVAESKDVDSQNKWKEREGTLSAEAITALAKHYSEKGADSFGLYESTLFTWCPDVRRAIREAGWNYKVPQRRSAALPPKP
jgi:hypothetical protein